MVQVINFALVVRLYAPMHLCRILGFDSRKTHSPPPCPLGITSIMFNEWQNKNFPYMGIYVILTCLVYWAFASLYLIWLFEDRRRWKRKWSFGLVWFTPSRPHPFCYFALSRFQLPTHQFSGKPNINNETKAYDPVHISLSLSLSQSEFPNQLTCIFLESWDLRLDKLSNCPRIGMFGFDRIRTYDLKNDKHFLIF